MTDACWMAGGAGNSYPWLTTELVLGTLFVLDVLIGLHCPYILRYKNEKL